MTDKETPLTETTTTLPVLKDSGKREEMATGSKRDSREGKGRFDLLPTRALARLSRHFEAGSVKYGDRNWEKGQPLSRMLDSALRHAFKYLQGETDEDHLIAACWNLMCCADTEERIKAGLLPAELNDLPKGATGLTKTTDGVRCPRCEEAIGADYVYGCDRHYVECKCKDIYLAADFSKCPNCGSTDAKPV